MKARFLLLIFTFLLTSCTLTRSTYTLEPSYESSGYREYTLEMPDDISFYDFKNEHTFIEKRTEGSKKIASSRAYYEYAPFPSYTLPQPYVGGFQVGGHEFWIVESGRTYIEKTGKGDTWWEAQDPTQPGAKYTLYKDGAVYKDLTSLISKPLCFGFDGFEGMFEYMRWVDEKLFFTYQKGRCGPKTESDIYADGASINEKYSLEGSQYYFEVNGKQGFVGRKDGQEYLYLDGVPISRGFETIYTGSCCAAPQFFFDMYEDGKIFFVGSREKNYYLVEVGGNL